MQDAMKRVEELKQETIEKSKKIPNSEAIVKARLEEYEKTKKQVNHNHIQSA
jgi:hypothetical protein